MQRRSPARFLAPLALLLVFGAALSVVRSDDRPTDSGAVEPGRVETTTTTTTMPTTSTQPRRKTYTVRSGDVLSAIAEREGVRLERILELNPGLDPQSLRMGQQVRLRR